MSPDQYCEQKAAASGSSFYYAFRFLPPERRRAITALYAFCREVDDAVDEPHEPSVARARIDWWREEVASLYVGNAKHPVALALVPAVAQYDLQRELLEEIIAGMAMDLDQHRYANFEQLQLYCHRVAGVVGALAARIFGYTNPRTLEYADRLGLSLQLTNIIRDIGEDARRNRIYVPIDELARFNVTAADILQGKPTENFRRLMAFQIERAQSTYAEALALLPDEDRRAQRTGLVMAAIYRTLLAEIGRAPELTLTQRTTLPPIRKLWIAWKTWIAA
jgi:15-cis-phytoene synthase